MFKNGGRMGATVIFESRSAVSVFSRVRDETSLPAVLSYSEAMNASIFRCNHGYALLFTSRREVIWEICSKSNQSIMPLVISLLRSYEPKRAIVRGGGLACSVALNARLNPFAMPSAR